MSNIDYIAMAVGYIVIFIVTGMLLFVLLYALYWCVLIPLHCSVMYNKAYRAHSDSEAWTDEYKQMSFRVLRMWIRGMKSPFHYHNARVESSLITIDYTGKIPRTTIVK